MNREKLWNKSFIMLMLGNLFVFMSFQMLIPTLPPYIKSMGATGLEIGLVSSLFSIGAVLSRPFIGHMLQYKARKQIVLIGALALLLITLLYPLSRIIVIFLLVRLVHGLAWGWSTTVNGTAAVDVVPNSRLGEGMGYFGLSTTLGMVIAPSLGIYLFHATSFVNLIYISTILGVLAIILLSIVQYSTPDIVSNTNKKDLRFSYLSSMLEKSSWYPALITIMVTFGYGTIITFIVIFGEERGIEHIFLFYLCNALVASVSRPLAGKWFDQKGPKGLIFLCSTLTFVGMWILSFATSDLGLAIAGVLFGLGFGSLLPTLQAWTLAKTPSNRRGVANGMYNSAIDLGIGLSGFVFGVLAQYMPIASLFRISSVFLIVSIVLTLFENKKRNIEQEKMVS